MKILLTNYSLGWLGGTQTWVMTMAEELVNLGHEVYLFAGDSNYSLMPGYKTIDPSIEYDLALINHNSCLTALDGLNVKKKIFTSHGILPELEQPIEGADIYVSVSEEVQKNLSDKGFPSVVIRNPINVDLFLPTKVNEKLTNILYMSNYQGKVLDIIKEASSGYNLKVYGKNEQIDNLTAMKDADLVIGLGRTAYEAMSMNKNVIIFDYNGADGLATPASLLEFRKNNCSGRRYGMKLNAEQLREMFELYSPELNLRDYIIENNDVVKIAQQYLNL